MLRLDMRLSVLFQKSWGVCRNLMNLNSADCTLWHPVRIINPKRLLDGDYAILVLNRRVNVPKGVAEQLWQNVSRKDVGRSHESHYCVLICRTLFVSENARVGLLDRCATIRITVDGGTNRWMSFIEGVCKRVDMKPPDIITGDFDSVTEDALKFFDSPQTRKIRTPDQDETDFTKALKIKHVIVLHETCGRLDQIMANIQTVCKAPNILEAPVYLLGSNSLTWLLKTGKHSICIPPELVKEKKWCALIPVKGNTTVTTTGLKWNLDGRDLAFGDLVSTSNTYASDVVNISTNKDLLWSMAVFEDEDE